MTLSYRHLGRIMFDRFNAGAPISNTMDVVVTCFSCVVQEYSDTFSNRMSIVVLREWIVTC